MSYGMTTWTPDLVQQAKEPHKAFAEYCRQVAGMPYPSHTDLNKLKTEVNKFFKQYPQCDWRSMCRIIRWMTARKIRVPRVSMVLNYHRDAWAKGGLPELDARNATDDEADRLIQCAINIEEDPQWLDRLALAQSPKAKWEVYSLWEQLSPSVNA